MAVRTRPRTRRGLRYIPIRLTDFSGGLNLRDAPTELAVNETPNCWNVTCDERGGIGKRLGMARWNATAVTNNLTYAYYSVLTSKLVWYSQADGRMYYDTGNGILTLARTWTAGYEIGITDFAGTVYAIHPIDGLYASTNGAGWGKVTVTTGTAPVGSILTVWQNKLHVAGDPAHPNRVAASSAGDAKNWGTAAPDTGYTVDIRDVDDGAITALYSGSGFDQQTKPALLVFKDTSTHRIYDSTTGAYLTLDTKVGAASAKSVQSAYSRVYALSRRGIFATDGYSPMAPVSERISRLFTDQGIAMDRLSNFAAGYQAGQLHFSLTRNGGTVNDLALRLHPLQGWITAGSDAAGCYVTYLPGRETLLAGSPTATGRAYRMNTGGTDDGVQITSWFETKVFEPSGGAQARLQRVRQLARGTFTVSIRTDFQSLGPTVALPNAIGSSGGVWGSFAWTVDPWGVFSTLSAEATGFLWDAGVWDVDYWGDERYESYRDWSPRVVGRAFQLRVDETSAHTALGLPQFDTGLANDLGAWGVYATEFDFAPLGFS